MQIGVETPKAVDQRRVFVVKTGSCVPLCSSCCMLHDEIETHELASPEEAYEIGSHWVKPYKILLGVSFLKTRGVELIGESATRFPGVRILIVTGKSDEATAVEGLKKGAHGALVKPLTLEAVRKTDIDNRNDNGATCLMYAASSGKPDVIGRLLARGADTRFETLDGFNALDLCSTLECLTLLRRRQPLRAPPKAPSSTGTEKRFSHEDRRHH